MPQWYMSEIGYALCIFGFVLLIVEWAYAYITQGNSLVREDLLVHLEDWRNADTFEHGTPDETRAACIRRMRKVLPEIRGFQREMFRGYICTLSHLNPTDTKWLRQLEVSIRTGNPIDEKEKRPKRLRLVWIGAPLVIIGTICQGIGSGPPFWGLCDTKELRCPQK